MTRLFETTSRSVSAESLGEVELFEGVSAEELGRLAASFVEIEVASQQVVFEEGERADAFFIVADGALAAYRDAPGQPVQLLARFHKNDFFGELGLVGEPGRYAASVRASERSRVLRVGREEFQQFLENRPDIQLKLQMVAARRYSNAVGSALEMGRRREVRVRCNRDMTVELGDGARRTMRLENLSLGGACMADVPERWTEGAEVRFALVLREGLLWLDGRVRWRQGKLVGISFNPRTPSHDMLLQMAIRLLLETES